MVSLAFVFGFSQARNFKLGGIENFEKASSQEAKSAFNLSLLRARPISVSPEFFQKGTINPGDNIELNLFPGFTFQSAVIWVTTDVNFTTTYVAKIDGFDFSFAVISVNGADVLVSIDMPELAQKYTTRLDPNDRSLHLVMLDTGNLDFIEGGHPDEEVAKITNQGQDLLSMSDGDKLTGNFLTNELHRHEAEIDLMVVFTPNAATWANTNEGNINNTIANAMAWCNISSAFSELGITFNLVYSDMVTYTESGDSGTDLSRLRNSGDGHMDIIHHWRNTHNADMVSLLTQVSDVGGVGYLLRRKHGDIDTGYSITRVQQASNTFTMIHEIGHNMAAHHHAGQNVQPGPTIWEDWPENTWSAGWFWIDNAGNYFCDLMTYNSGQFFNELSNTLVLGRVPVFSSPRVFHSGKATGDVSIGDNARTLIQVKHFVSKYRDPITSQYCNAAGGNPSSFISAIEAGGILVESGNRPYYDYSFINPSVVAGQPLQVRVNINAANANNQLLAWIDWNDNKVFEAEGEQVFSETANTTHFIITITPPVETPAGRRRLRLRLNNIQSINNPNSTPCGVNGVGEVKDLSITVLPVNCQPVAILQQPTNKTMCRTTGSTTLQVTTMGQDSDSYQWQYLRNGVWTQVENGHPAGAVYAGAASSTLSVSGITSLGSFYYRCVVSSCAGASVQYSRNAILKTVTNLAQPSAITGNTNPCQGLTLSYFVDNVEDASYVWEVPSGWVINGEGTGNVITVVIGSQGGNVSVRAVNSCGTSSARTLAVTVAQAPPRPTLTLLEGNVLQSSAPTGNRWFRNNLIILGASGQTFTAQSDGYYHVRVTLNGCNSENSNVVAIGVVSINEAEEESLIKIFPNPVKNKLTIETTNEHKPSSYSILNLAGQVIEMASFEKRVEIDTQGWSNGIYIVRVVTSKGTLSRKVVKN